MSLVSNGAGLFAVMGSGKSLCSVSLVNIMQAKRTLILCPSSVVGVWPREFRKFSGDEFNLVPLRDPSKRSPLSVAKKFEMAKAALDAQDAQDALSAHDFTPDSAEDLTAGTIIIVNYESAWRDNLNDLLLSVEWDLVILDESHKIKSPTGKAAKFCHKLGAKAKYKIALTGTEQPHSPLDVFSQYQFLNPAIFGSSFYGFKKRYATTNNWNTVVGFINLEDMKQKIETIAFRINEDDLDYELPPVTHVTIETELYGEARKLYEEILEGMWVKLEEVEGESAAVKASVIIAQLTRCAQITGGFVGGVYDPNIPEDQQEPRVKRVKGATKAQALCDIIESIKTKSQGKDNDHKLVVFCRFKEDLKQVAEIAAKYNLAYGEISGRTKDGLNEDAHMNPACDIVGCQLQAGGVGIDLTACRYVVYWNKDFSFGNLEQSLKRAHRPGQKHPVTFYHLVAPDTVDQRIEDSLESKESVVEFFRHEADKRAEKRAGQ